MRDRPRRAVVALEGRTGRAEDGRLQTSIVVRGPVEDAAEELGADEARRDGREGRRFRDEGGVVDHAPETREERRRHGQSHVRRVIQRVARQDQRGHRALGLGPPLRSRDVDDVDGVEGVDHNDRRLLVEHRGGFSSSPRRPPRRHLERHAGCAARQQCRSGSDAWPSSAAHRLRRHRRMLSVTGLVGGLYAPQRCNCR